MTAVLVTVECVTLHTCFKRSLNELLNKLDTRLTDPLSWRRGVNTRDSRVSALHAAQGVHRAARVFPRAAPSRASEARRLAHKLREAALCRVNGAA
jgi:hypothetical protein